MTDRKIINELMRGVFLQCFVTPIYEYNREYDSLDRLHISDIYDTWDYMHLDFAELDFHTDYPQEYMEAFSNDKELGIVLEALINIILSSRDLTFVELPIKVFNSLFKTEWDDWGAILYLYYSCVVRTDWYLADGDYYLTVAEQFEYISSLDYDMQIADIFRKLMYFSPACNPSLIFVEIRYDDIIKAYVSSGIDQSILDVLICELVIKDDGDTMRDLIERPENYKHTIINYDKFLHCIADNFDFSYTGDEKYTDEILHFINKYIDLKPIKAGLIVRDLESYCETHKSIYGDSSESEDNNELDRTTTNRYMLLEKDNLVLAIMKNSSYVVNKYADDKTIADTELNNLIAASQTLLLKGGNKK